MFSLRKGESHESDWICLLPPACCVLFAAFCQTTAAWTLCVNPAGSNGCYSKIQDAVNHASANDVIEVGPGTYKEYVTIGKPVSIIGAGAESSIIDATNLAHGFFVDGFYVPGLKNVTLTGFTVENAMFEGIVVGSTWDVIINDNHVINNDKSPGLGIYGDLTGCPDEPGSGMYENDETGDCGRCDSSDRHGERDCVRQPHHRQCRRGSHQ